MVCFHSGLLLDWHRFLRSGSGRLFSSSDALQPSITGCPLWNDQDVWWGLNIWVMYFSYRKYWQMLLKLYLKTLTRRLDSCLKISKRKDKYEFTNVQTFLYHRIFCEVEWDCFTKCVPLVENVFTVPLSQIRYCFVSLKCFLSVPTPRW